MKISRNSWTYWIWGLEHPYAQPRDLCSFVRGLVYSTVKRFALLCVAAVLTLFLLFVAVSPFLYSWFSILELEAPAIAAFTFYLIAGMWYIVYLTTEELYNRRYNRPSSPPGIIRSYYRAKKQKICPLIEVTE